MIKFCNSSIYCKTSFFWIIGKLVFAEPTPKDSEAASWREKLDQLYKSSSQSFRVVVHGSKVIIFLIFCITLYMLRCFPLGSSYYIFNFLKENYC